MAPASWQFRATGDPPAVVGHRGAPLVARENTPAAFAAAVAQGAAWVELDVRRAGDGLLVVHHDPATPDGRPLVDRTAADLAAVGISALADVLLGLEAGIGVDIEVKNLPGQPDYDEEQEAAGMLADLLADLPTDAGAGRPLLTSSFNPETVAALAQALPDVPAGLLHAATLAVDAAARLAAEYGARALCSHIDAEGADARGIAAAHDLGLPVLVWTVDDPGRALALADAGADALCTNDPAAIVAALRDATPRR